MNYRSSRYGRGNGDPSGALIIFGIIIGLVVFIAIYNYFRKKKIREYCEKNRLMYEESPVCMTGYSEAYDIYNYGHSSYFSAGMYGKKADIELNIVDYSYVTGYGKNRHTHNYTLCQLYREGPQFPCFFVRDENVILDSIGSMLGGQDIDFAEDNKFSSRFVLQGIDESDIRRFFNSKVRLAFNKYHQRGYCYESKGRAFLVYKRGHASLNGRIAMLNTALKIFNEISKTDFKLSTNDIPKNPKYYGNMDSISNNTQRNPKYYENMDSLPDNIQRNPKYYGNTDSLSDKIQRNPKYYGNNDSIDNTSENSNYLS